MTQAPLKRRVLTVLIGLIVWFPSAKATQPVNTFPKPYTAKYSLMKNGATVAEATYTLAQAGQGWKFSAHARPRGFMSFFISDEINESSAFEIDGSSIKPLQYRFEQGPPKARNRETLEVHYNWQEHNAQVSNPQKTRQVAIKRETYDPLSVQLALMQRTQRGCDTAEYAVFHDMELQIQKFECSSGETLRTSLGNYDTVRVSYRSGKRETLIWFAPALNYIPVKIQQLRENKLKSEMRINSVKFE
ncbi:MAG TPA: DUF3108 domain-containing protein [Gammaproteobacteria bacterium]